MSFENENIAINNEFNYSTIIPEVEIVSYLVQYCESVYNYMLKLFEEDEKRNEPLKYDYRNYQYKKSYSFFKINITDKNHHSQECDNYASFLNLVESNRVSNVNSLKIELGINYKRGREGSNQNYENSFKISFNPYEIMFYRKSSIGEEEMDQVEKNINEIMRKFKTANSIFATK